MIGNHLKPSMARLLSCLALAACGRSVDQGACPQYIACTEATGTPSATLLATYGDEGVCWSEGDGNEALLCRAHCADNLAAMATAWPNVPECQPPPGPPPEAVDLLLVVDRSPTMAEANGALALRLDAFFDALAESDVQASIVGIEVSMEDGRLIDGPHRSAAPLRKALLCEATCIFDTSHVPSDPDHVCGETPTAISREYLDCTCGSGAWTRNCGNGNEEGLEAALLAVCRADDDPPELCFGTLLSPQDVGSNEGLLRDDATLAVLAVSDEGDGSRRLTQGSPEVSTYVEAFQSFGRPVVWSVIGPDPDNCDSWSPRWSIERYRRMVSATGGVYVPLVGGHDCALTDFESALTRVGHAL